ncbi:Abi-domain-containing protein [Serendipita vermifera]|nr:Abi-domain-containing protein [Serendipita vermifera]
MEFFRRKDVLTCRYTVVDSNLYPVCDRRFVMLTREQAPVISGTTAWLISAFFATSYVASLYMFRAGRLGFRQQKVEAGPNASGARAYNEEGRNNPTVIKARLFSVAISTLFSCGIMLAVITKAGSWNFGDSEAIHQTAKLLGLTLPTGVPLGAWFLAPIMYTGTLYTEILDRRSHIYRHEEEGGSIRWIFTTWIGFRNIIGAPITEEIVYRSCVVGIMKLSGASMMSMVFLSPLWFGAAHLHHGWDLFNRLGRSKRALKSAVLTVVFQQLYTSIFGWFEAFVLLRTGSIWPCIFAHSFCNFYGVPLPNQGIQNHPSHKIDIIIAHILGLVAFCFTLGPWTRV